MTTLRVKGTSLVVVTAEVEVVVDDTAGEESVGAYVTGLEVTPKGLFLWPFEPGESEAGIAIRKVVERHATSAVLQAGLTSTGAQVRSITPIEIDNPKIRA